TKELIDALAFHIAIQEGLWIDSNGILMENQRLGSVSLPACREPPPGPHRRSFDDVWLFLIEQGVHRFLAVTDKVARIKRHVRAFHPQNASSVALFFFVFGSRGDDHDLMSGFRACAELLIDVGFYASAFISVKLSNIDDLHGTRGVIGRKHRLRVPIERAARKR